MVGRILSPELGFVCFIFIFWVLRKGSWLISCGGVGFRVVFVCRDENAILMMIFLLGFIVDL